MGDFTFSSSYPYPLVTISSFQWHSVLSNGCQVATYNTSTVWPAANRAIYIPFRIGSPFTFTKIWGLNGTSAFQSFDIGIYSEGGTRIISTASQAQAGTSAIQSFTVASTTLAPGLYYFGVAKDGTSGTVNSMSILNAPTLQTLGLFQQASAFPLPATSTFASVASDVVPHVGITGRATV